MRVVDVGAALIHPNLFSQTSLPPVLGPRAEGMEEGADARYQQLEIGRVRPLDLPYVGGLAVLEGQALVERGFNVGPSRFAERGAPEQPVDARSPAGISRKAGRLESHEHPRPTSNDG